MIELTDKLRKRLEATRRRIDDDPDSLTTAELRDLLDATADEYYWRRVAEVALARLEREGPRTQGLPSV